MEIKIKRKEKVEYFIKRFKSIIEKSVTISNLKDKIKGYKKPSLIKRQKLLNKIKKIQKNIRFKNYFRRLH